MIRIFESRGRGSFCAISFCSSKSLEESHWDQPTRVRHGRVAGFVPIRVILAPDDMKEVTTREAKLLTGSGFIVIQGSNNLREPKALALSFHAKNLGQQQEREGGEEFRMFTFLGGTIATADFGARLIWGSLSFSPLMERRRAWKSCILVSREIT